MQAQVKHYWICTRPSGGAKFNDYACGVSTPEPAAPTTPTTTPNGTVDAARSFDKSLAGTYKVTASAGLNIRAGAGTGKKILGVLKRGTSVRCYGYYTKVNGVPWLYVVAGSITGFVSKNYLQK